MTKIEALSILKCDDEQDVLDCYEMALFELKNKVLQQVPPIKILQSLIKKTERINQALGCFKNLPQSNKVPLLKDYESNLTHNLVTYQSNISALRLAMTQSENGLEVIQCFKQIINQQISLFKIFGNCIANNEVNAFIDQVKLSEEINVYAVQKELKTLLEDQKKISEYIRTELNTKEFVDFSELTKSVIKSKKHLDFNGLN